MERRVKLLPEPEAPSSPNAPPIASQPTGSITLLDTVRPGDLITADFMNAVVQTVNQIITYLRNQSAAAPPSSTPTAPPPPPSSGAGLVGTLKGVQFSAADAQDKVTVTFPAEAVNPGDFADILVGNTRVDPSELVKSDNGFSFKVNKEAITGGTDVRAVSKGGAAAQSVMTLFK